MSNTSKEAMQKVYDLIRTHIIPKWIDSFLQMIFFEKCLIHDLPKNELTRFCITCEASICRHCVRNNGHKDHKVLTIHRHAYQDVVPLSEMENHIDCDNVQSYKCNKKWVVSSKPLPRNSSGLLIEGDGACYVCKGNLSDQDRFRFCSIACKVQGVYGTCTIENPETLDVGSSQSGDVGQDHENMSKRKRSRKGVPHRSPLS